MHKSLHVVAFDVPYPPNYGGAIDVFYRIKALHAIGLKIRLHAFTYRDRQAAPELRAYCEKVYYYPRPFHARHLFRSLPYIVLSRKVGDLRRRLADQPYPVLFEGLHTCGFIGHPSLRDHFKMVRMHNVESQYYRHLGRMETQPLRGWHFRQESRKIDRFEAVVLEGAQVILPISTRDEKYFRSKGAETVLLPAFHGQREVTGLAGSGEYVLFHGNLSVLDNEKAALFLIRKVMKDRLPPLVIAGRRPSSRLRSACARAPQVMLAENPTQEEMADLIRQAHINVLYTYQPDGIKIKLLRALYQGRHVLTNEMMVAGTGLESLCTVAEEAEDLHAEVARLMRVPFREDQLSRRRRLLQSNFSDQVGAETLLALLPDPAA